MGEPPFPERPQRAGSRVWQGPYFLIRFPADVPRSIAVSYKLGEARAGAPEVLVMPNSRRSFLMTSAAALVGVASVEGRAQTGANPATVQPQSTPGSPPAVGNSRAVGPNVIPADFAAAEKLVQIELTERERAQTAENWRNTMAPLCERRTGPRRVPLRPDMAPALLWHPNLPGTQGSPHTDRF